MIRFLGSIFTVFILSVSGQAATITVTSLEDNTTVDGLVTLREAILASESGASVDGSAAGTGNDEIVFDPALFAGGDRTLQLTLFSPGTGSGDAGPAAFTLSKTLTITGQTGNSGLTLEVVGDEFRFFDILPAASLTLQHLTLKGGTARGGSGGRSGGGGAAGMGGAIFNDGTLVVTHCLFTENRAFGGVGHPGTPGDPGGGGGGMGENGGTDNDNGGDGGDPQGGAGGTGGSGSGGNGGFGGGGGGGDKNESAGGGFGGNGGDGGFAGGGGGGGYKLGTGGGTFTATSGDGGDGGFGAGGGGGGGVTSFNGTRVLGSAGAGGWGGGDGTQGNSEASDSALGGDGGGGAGFGGAIFNRGTATINNSTFSTNHAEGGKCGDDYALGDGGGGDGRGGAIFNYNGNLTINNCTLNGNSCEGGASDAGLGTGASVGGALYSLGNGVEVTVTLNNSIFANSAALLDVAGTGINGGGNSFNGSGNLIEAQIGLLPIMVTNLDPQLGGLADNGGPTMTHALLTGSPAIDNGVNDQAVGATDQRGGIYNRIQDGDLNGSSIVDIGAYELLIIDFGDAPDFETGTGLNNRLIPASTLTTRTSFMGNEAETNPTTRANFDAANSAVAYNATDNEYLVVWSGDDDTGLLANDEMEIYAQRLHGSSGNLIGQRRRVSTMASDGDNSFSATKPRVVWNSINNVYLVVWSADNNTGALVDDEFEIYGQFLTAGATNLNARFRISNMGDDGNTALGSTSDPDVAFNATDNKYLVVWRGEDDTPPVTTNEFEIYARQVTGLGPSGPQMRVSVMGNDAEVDPAIRDDYAASHPRVAWNSANNHYFIVWHGDDDSGALINGEDEIWGRTFNSSLAPVSSQTRISQMGPDGNASFRASNPDVVYNPISSQYAVVWTGDNTNDPIDNENEVFFKALNSSLTTVVSQKRISTMGPDSNVVFSAAEAAIHHNPILNTYLVVWRGEDSLDNKFDIYGQGLSSAGVEIGADDFLVAQAAAADDPAFDFFTPDLTFNPLLENYLVSVHGTQDLVPLVSNEAEIFTQRVRDQSFLDYNTLGSDNGPSHRGRPGLSIGSLIDTEIDGRPTLDADGDDDAGIDDEDGIPGSAVAICPGENLTIKVLVNNTSGDFATLYGWFDKDRDGAFENATERVSVGVPSGSINTNVILNFGTVPLTTTNSTYIRLRLGTTAASADPTGAALDGEVEDYPAWVQPTFVPPHPLINEGGFFTATFVGEKGAVYIPQASFNTEWTTLFTIPEVFGTGEPETFSDNIPVTNIISDVQFIRLIRKP